MIFKALGLIILAIPLPFFLAQMEAPVGISGNAGWVGAGMLGLVMSWLLLVRLPAGDKQMKDMVDMYVNDLKTQHKEARADYLAAIDRIIARMDNKQ